MSCRNGWPWTRRSWPTCALGLRSGLAAPIQARSYALGALSAACTTERAPYDEDDLSLLVVVAQRAGLALDNASLVAQARQETAALERASQAKDALLAVRLAPCPLPPA